MVYVLEELDVYRKAYEMSNFVWDIVIKWEAFAKFGLGKQLTSSADSIAANIAEGYGRFSIKENIHFCFYARGSLLETKSWINKARARELLTEQEFTIILQDLTTLHKGLNAYIKVLKQNLLRHPQPGDK